MPSTHPYGFWRSPITSELIISESVGLSGTCWGTGDYVGNQSPGGGSLVPPGTVVSLQMAVNPP